MKYFVLSAVAAIGFANATTPDPCFGDEYQKFLNQTLHDLTGGNETLETSYLVRSKKYNEADGYGSNFVTIACRYRSWQGQDGDVYDPYSVNKWSPFNASRYAASKADNNAMDEYAVATGANGEDGKWRAGAFGRYRCGNRRNATGATTRGWKNLRAPVKCHEYDYEGGWVQKLNDFNSVCVSFWGNRYVNNTINEGDFHFEVKIMFENDNYRQHSVNITSHTNQVNANGQYFYRACGLSDVIKNATFDTGAFRHVLLNPLNFDNVYAMKIEDLHVNIGTDDFRFYYSNRGKFYEFEMDNNSGQFPQSPCNQGCYLYDHD